MILIAGPPGAGKSVQAKLLEENYNVKWLSMGALLRQTVDDDVIKIMEKGEMLDDEMVERVLAEAIEKISDQTRILVDGFPRRDSQVKWFLDYVDQIERSFQHAIHIMTSFDTSLSRLTKRGRFDDLEEVIKRRFGIYEHDILPMLQHLEHVGVEVHEIDGEQTIEEVHSDIAKALKDIIV